MGLLRRISGKAAHLLGLNQESPAVPILPDLQALVASDPALWSSTVRAGASSGQKVLVATSAGGHLACATLEGMLSVALALRGADVHVLLCDGVLPACLECDYIRYPDFSDFVATGPQADRCEGCFEPARRMFDLEGITTHTFSEFLTDQEREGARELARTLTWDEILNYSAEGIAIGEHALAGTLRFFARGELDGQPFAEEVLRRYFEAGLLTTHVSRAAFTALGIEVAVFNHGIYVPQGVIGEVARDANVRVVNWNPAYRKQCFIFSHDDSYHHTLMDEPTSLWEDIEWTPELETRIMEYLASRWHGTNDWIWFHEQPELSVQSIAAETGVDFSKPCIGLLTNVVWDAQLHYPANAFPNMVDWLVRTIEYFDTRPDLQLLVRIHPAENRGTLASRQRIADEIARHFEQTPPNVFVIPPESNVSTYAAMAQCDSVIIFGTKTGVELTSMGIPVIVAGEAWIRNKGITMDASSAEDYFHMLDALPIGHRSDGAALERARKYAFHFFMRRMIPIEFMQPTGGWPPYMVAAKSLADLAPGGSLGLDVICDGVLAGTPFVYPAEDESADQSSPASAGEAR